MKPIVYYEGPAVLIIWYEGSLVASIQDVIDHPSLGNCPQVRTSYILGVQDDGTIETRNTIYKSTKQEKYKLQRDLTQDTVNAKILENQERSA